MAETYGEQLKRRRCAAELTQQDLATLAGISRTTVRNLESGKHAPRPAIAEAIWAALDQSERDEQAAHVAGTAERIARRLDTLANNYPEDLFPDDDSTPEAIRVMRRIYRHAARIARGEA
ncbi:helix-turn-helix transcriptional regulator [Streptosporangium sp. NPDC000239]|uniref:helix-turn-helix transcriptional regulator n=1 Tax=Streptosporangium sp. NPDC000239 TaxID=3154248 RepID=UPI00331CA515